MGATFTVAVYLMQVLDQRNRWQEASFRERRWTSLNDAILLLSDHPVRPLLDRAISVLAVAPGSPSSSSRRADRSG
jgi:hypothetical protein